MFRKCLWLNRNKVDWLVWSNASVWRVPHFTMSGAIICFSVEWWTKCYKQQHILQINEMHSRISGIFLSYFFLGLKAQPVRIVFQRMMATIPWEVTSNKVTSRDIPWSNLKLKQTLHMALLRSLEVDMEEVLSSTFFQIVEAGWYFLTKPLVSLTSPSLAILTLVLGWYIS